MRPRRAGRGDPDDRHGRRVRAGRGGAGPGAGPDRDHPVRPRPGEQVLLAHVQGAERSRPEPQAHRGVGRRQPAPAADGLPRPLPVPPVRPRGPAGGDRARAGGPGAAGKDPVLGHVGLERRPDRARARPGPRRAGLRPDLEPATLQPHGARDRGGGPADLPPARRGADRVLAARPGRAHGQVRRRGTSHRQPGGRREAQRLHGALPGGRADTARGVLRGARCRGGDHARLSRARVVSRPARRGRGHRRRHARGAGRRERRAADLALSAIFARERSRRERLTTSQGLDAL